MFLDHICPKSIRRIVFAYQYQRLYSMQGALKLTVAEHFTVIFLCSVTEESQMYQTAMSHMALYDVNGGTGTSPCLETVHLCSF